MKEMRDFFCKISERERPRHPTPRKKKGVKLQISPSGYYLPHLRRRGRQREALLPGDASEQGGDLSGGARRRRRRRGEEENFPSSSRSSPPPPSASSLAAAFSPPPPPPLPSSPSGGDGKNQSPRRPEIVPGPRLSTVELRDVRYTYPNRSGAPALDGVRLVLTKGRRVALVGGSGSGKSTLVQLVLRLRDPDPENGGAVLLNGYDAREVCARWRSSRMALVEQKPRLFTDTVERNIAYGCRIVEDEESEERRSASSSLWSSPTSTSTSSASDSSILFSFGGDSSPAAPSFSSSSVSRRRR